MILLCSLLIVILAHEMGHLLAARLFKCDVIRFSIGFGKVLLSKKIGKTIYQLAILPLGGFCELRGELEYTRSKFAFVNKTYSQKVIIALAGILINILMGFISFGVFFVTGNDVFLYFSIYSILLGLSNALPIPALDGFYPIIFLFEKKWGKKKTYRIWGSICKKWFFWLMILNVLSVPYIIWSIYTGQIL